MWRIVLITLISLCFSSPGSAQENGSNTEAPKNVAKMVLRVNTRDKMMICTNNMHKRMHQHRRQEMIKRNQMQMQRRMQINHQRRLMRQQSLHHQRIQQRRIQQQRVQQQMKQNGAGQGR